MSLRSKMLSASEQVDQAGRQPDANREELLSAALLESQERYARETAKQTAALQELRDAVRVANDTRTEAVNKALADGATGILSPLYEASQACGQSLRRAAGVSHTRAWIAAFAVWTALVGGLGYYAGGGGYHKQLDRIEYNVTYPDAHILMSDDDARAAGKIQNQIQFEVSEKAKALKAQGAAK